MKTNALLAFFLFLVALFASTRAEFVLDSEGNPVDNGGRYYFVPHGLAGGAIGVASIAKPDGCSLAVVLTNKGSATLIQSMVPTANIIPSSALQLSFQPLPSNNCTKHPEWIVATDAELGENAVMIGDPSEYDNPVAGLFYFQTYNSAEHHYILVFCSKSLYPSCEPVAIKTAADKKAHLIIAKKAAPMVLKLLKTSGDRVVSHLSMVV